MRVLVVTVVAICKQYANLVAVASVYGITGLSSGNSVTVTINKMALVWFCTTFDSCGRYARLFVSQIGTSSEVSGPTHMPAP
jgi:hypothetical protein